MKNTTVALVLTGITFLLGSLGYIIITSLFGNVFGGLYRMYMYHEAYPFQYIGIVAIIFGLLGTVWLRCFGVTMGWKRYLSIIFCIVFTVLVSSEPGGVLWMIHDMQAGYFTEGVRFWSNLWSGAVLGLLFGWFIILHSIPYNLIGFLTGGLLLHRLPYVVSKIEEHKHTAKE